MAMVKNWENYRMKEIGLVTPTPRLSIGRVKDDNYACLLFHAIQ